LGNADHIRHFLLRMLRPARKAEAFVRRLLAENDPKPEPDAHLALLQDKLKMVLGTDVSIQMRPGPGRGKIEISFSSEAEFERLMSILTEENDGRERSTFSSFHI